MALTNYAVYMLPDFLLNGSYCNRFQCVRDVELYVASQKQPYKYPIMTSIIGIAHAVLSLGEEQWNFIKQLFEADYISDTISISQHFDEYITGVKQTIAHVTQMEYLKTSDCKDESDSKARQELVSY